MRYRLATESDRPSILELLDRKGLDRPDPYDGGTWMVAVDGETVVGTIWFFHEAPYAYVDGWAGSGVPAVMLAFLTEAILAGLGVRRVMGAIQLDNHRSLNTMVKRFQVQSDGHGYYLAYKDIGNGKAEG